MKVCVLYLMIVKESTAFGKYAEGIFIYGRKYSKPS